MFSSAFFTRSVFAAFFLTSATACSPFKTESPVSRVNIPAYFTVLSNKTNKTDLTAWWIDWEDPLLTQLVQSALEANPDLRVAQARVQEARSYTRIANSTLYPTVGVMGSMMGGGMDWRHPVPPLLKAADPDIQDPATNGHLAGITMAWEPDIWGAHKAQKRGAEYMALAAQDALHATHMAIAADVAANYVTARGLQQRIVLLDKSISTLKGLLDYANARFDAGQTTQADLQIIHSQTAQAQSQRPLLVAALDSCLHRLAILSGQPPEKAPNLSALTHYKVPSPPAVELPSVVLERRPDVWLQKHFLDAKLQKLISTKTDLLPHFGLEFFGGDGRLRFDGIPGVSGSGGLMAVNAYLPVFNAGRIRAQIQADDTQVQQALAAYDKTILTALAEVEDAYESRYSADQNIMNLDSEVELLARANSQAQGLYEGGRFTMQEVLMTRMKKISAQDELVSAQTRQALSTIQLARALGGGWDSRNP